MPINNLNDGVGKKIVEALKMQSVEASDDNFITEDIEETPAENERYTQETVSQQANTGFYQNPETKFTQTQSFVDAAFSQSLAQNMMNGNKFNSFADDNYEYPANVAVLRQLIGKLPAGVSRQTGALIIKQTMEALGIPMNSVIQEAKQFQESLNTNSRECQANIAEYKKQISILEMKVQQYQRQSTIMNDIISLFIQTGSF